MLFGLFNIPTSFKNYINKILAKKLHIFVIIYLSNILISTKDLGQPHMKTICWVFDLLQKYRFFTNLKKYLFY